MPTGQEGSEQECAHSYTDEEEMSSDITKITEGDEGKEGSGGVRDKVKRVLKGVGQYILRNAAGMGMGGEYVNPTTVNKNK